jgi:2-methylcitrate dehydratase PrpD
MPKLTGQVADYIVSRRFEDWSDAAVEKVKVHLFDTWVAMESGRHLVAGQRALSYANTSSCDCGCRIIGGDFNTTPEVAAIVNGMLAHADETDDTSETARMHPGASIVPAALAIADLSGADGSSFLNAILIGYQVGIAFPQAVWADDAERMHAARATHNVGQVMGAVAAAGSLLRLDQEAMRFALSYAAQECSGVNSLYRERQHVEKAYVFGGMPASQGVRAARFAQLGFTGVPDILDTNINFFDTFACRSDPDLLMRNILDPEAGVFQADIKLYPVGLPIQAAAQAMDQVLAQTTFESSEIAEIVCHLPSQKAYVVDDRDMPPISLQYILSTMAEDGGLTFENSHDQGRLNRNRSDGLQRRVRLIHDDAMNPSESGGSRNRALLRIELTDGRSLVAQVDRLKGTRFQPATWGDMHAKARAILKGDGWRAVERGIRYIENVECLTHLFAVGH